MGDNANWQLVRSVAWARKVTLSSQKVDAFGSSNIMTSGPTTCSASHLFLSILKNTSLPTPFHFPSLDFLPIAFLPLPFHASSPSPLLRPPRLSPDSPSSSLGAEMNEVSSQRRPPRYPRRAAPRGEHPAVLSGRAKLRRPFATEHRSHPMNLAAEQL